MQRLWELARNNRLFAGAFGIGVLIRLFAVLGYPGALWFAGDSYVYLGAALRPQANLSKTTGYSLFLRFLLPFHSMTLVAVSQHLMGLADAVMIYALLRHSRVAKKWAAIASLPVLLDGYVIENEHLIMTEALFTFLLLAGLTIVLWKPKLSVWKAVIVGLLIGYAAIVRTEGAIVLVIFPLYVLIRGRSWKTLGGWVSAIVMCVGILVPVGGYAAWFHSEHGSYAMTRSTGFYLWGRMSSFADCARIQPRGELAEVCPTQSYKDRTPPGDFVWHAPQTHANLDNVGGPVTPAGNSLLTKFAIAAVEKQPLDYVKEVAKGVLMSFGFPRQPYPDPGTTYYYSFHGHYSGTNYDTLPPADHSWIKGGTAYSDWMSYGGEQPGVVNRIFELPLAAYSRVFYTWGPLLFLIFLVGLGSVFSIRRRGWKPTGLRWQIRGTSMLPWITAAVLVVFPTAIADFDYRYLIPVLPFACIAAGLAFAPGKRAQADAIEAPAGTESPAGAAQKTEATAPSPVS